MSHILFKIQDLVEDIYHILDSKILLSKIHMYILCIKRKNKSSHCALFVCLCGTRAACALCPPLTFGPVTVYKENLNNIDCTNEYTPKVHRAFSELLKLLSQCEIKKKIKD